MGKTHREGDKINGKELSWINVYSLLGKSYFFLKLIILDRWYKIQLIVELHYRNLYRRNVNMARPNFVMSCRWAMTAGRRNLQPTLKCGTTFTESTTRSVLNSENNSLGPRNSMFERLSSEVYLLTSSPNGLIYMWYHYWRSLRFHFK